ncbi:SDR family NAD(P)-dependent oxidoreductase [Streptoalloteichus hindustanus]|uniref:Short-chain dehydrogenase n=1 Tax=Streptoalloteichus hindustanus TaxID=2017 RepID=A0A1M5J7L9_STRHI|nr:SDR family NAD(P)-dependent oxidoreductase [Streptoalloteichus hindustanus]SHG36365.1 Short-chain dehydrogenase [Streptoalloteichus hindustanus]
MGGQPLTGRRILITGAAGAFGSATTAALRARGARVVGLDVAPGADPDDVVRCDLTDDESVRQGVASAVDRLGGLDVVVNNAGVGLPSDAGGPVDDAVRRTVEVNLLGAWRVTAAALPELLRSPDPRAVFVASGLAFVTVPFASAYTVAKRGLSAYADCLRVEYGGRLRVTTVYPGYVRTPIHEASRRAGVTLEGKVPAERVEDVVGTLLRVIAAGRPPRDTGTTRWGGGAIRFGRVLPGLVDRLVLARHRRDVARGAYDGVPIAERMVRMVRDDAERVARS